MPAISPLTLPPSPSNETAGDPLRVLLVEDNLADARLLTNLVAEHGLPLQLALACTLRQALAHAHGESCDAVLLDLALPDSAGLNTVHELALAFPRVPIVVLTGLDDEALAVQALRCGAQEYLVKGRHDVQAIERAIRHAMARKSYESVLGERANYDPLTGLVNRALLRDRLDHALARASRARTLLAVMFLDLDGFKPINDRLGHDAGDEVLKVFGGLLSRIARRAETVARLGGDEFVIVLEDVDDPSDALAVAQRILRGLEEKPLPIRPKDVQVSCSIGISIFPADGADAPTLLRHADIAMYAAKKRGPNNVEVCGSPGTVPRQT